MCAYTRTCAYPCVGETERRKWGRERRCEAEDRAREKERITHLIALIESRFLFPPLKAIFQRRTNIEVAISDSDSSDRITRRFDERRRNATRPTVVHRNTERRAYTLAYATLSRLFGIPKYALQSWLSRFCTAKDFENNADVTPTADAREHSNRCYL